MTDRCIIFVHIPKTAGTTLSSVFSWRYKSQMLGLSTLNRHPEVVEDVPVERRARARVVFGHVHFGVHRYFPQPCDYVTMLRDPVSRVLSVYRYILRTPSHPLYERITKSKKDFLDYVSSDMDQEQVDNGQTRQIGGLHFGDVTAEVLERAKSNLSSFAVVGLTERFDESFILLRRELGWRLPYYVSRKVAAGPQPPIPSEALDIIRERNRFDSEFYVYGTELFNQAIATSGRTFPHEVRAFRMLNKGPDRVIRKVLGG